MVSYLQSMRRTVKDLQTMPVESSRAGASQWSVPKHPKTQEVSRTWPGNMPPFGAPRVLQVPRPRRRRPTWRGSLVTKRSVTWRFGISLRKMTFCGGWLEMDWTWFHGMNWIDKFWGWIWPKMWSQSESKHGEFTMAAFHISYPANYSVTVSISST